jgi:hypothetical protein
MSSRSECNVEAPATWYNILANEALAGLQTDTENAEGRRRALLPPLPIVVLL